MAIYQKLREDELFLKAFKKSVGYVKLLAELDLLRDVHKNEELEDEDDESNSLESGEELSIYDSNSVQSCDSTDSGLPKSHKRTNSNVSNSSTGKKISSPESWAKSNFYFAEAITMMLQFDEKFRRFGANVLTFVSNKIMMLWFDGKNGHVGFR